MSEPTVRWWTSTEKPTQTPANNELLAGMADMANTLPKLWDVVTAAEKLLQAIDDWDCLKASSSRVDARADDLAAAVKRAKEQKP